MKVPLQKAATRGKAAHFAPPHHAGAAQAGAANPDLLRFFHELRHALGLSVLQTATQLGTSANVVQALETGRIADLPPWHETARIVTTYVRLVGVDPRPVLHIIAGEIERHATVAYAAQPGRNARHPELPRAAQRQQPAGRSRFASLISLGGMGRRIRDTATAPLRARWRRATVATAQKTRRARPRLKTLLAIAAPAALWIFASETRFLYTGAANLPAPIARIARPIQDYLLVTFAPVREGHRWIEVDDPRTRRSAKLQVRHN